MIFVNGHIHESASNPLGHASPDRYRPGSWPHALLQRMAYWLRRSHRHGHVLDLGCGEGALLEAAGLRGIGVDLNAERLALAAEKGLRVVRADGGSLPFADDTFDVVVCMEVLEHVPRMEAVMSEVARVLRPGGRWIISVPGITLRSWYEMKRYHKAFYCDEHEHYREFSPVDIKLDGHKFMRTETFERLFLDQGFTLVDRDGVRYLFPRWFSRLQSLQQRLESPAADRFWVKVPFIRSFPYWIIRVFRRRK
jgi:SAM-dependent methyltransferase